MIRLTGLQAVLFDLDGTLADTAPDLIGAANQLLRELGRPECDPAALRPRVSQGGNGILRAAMADFDPSDPTLLQRFLDIYRANICVSSALFPGMEEVLARIEAADIAWGIVTNKAHWLTAPLLRAMGLAARAGCVVCGDTLATRKPDPAPVLHACAMLGASAQRTVLLGDDVRDVQAARDAGAIAVAVGWGYGTAECIEQFGPQLPVANSSSDLLAMLGLE